MRILVMGGTEFISSALARRLIHEGYEVDIYTRGIRSLNYSGVRNHFKGERQSIENLKNNILDIEYDYVYDISAYCKKDVEILFTILNTNKLKRYILCSSGAVYKESTNIMNEDYELGFNNHWKDYGKDKLDAENYLFELHEERGIPLVIFRPTYVYGEGNNLYRETYFFDRILSGLKIPIPESTNKVQFIHIEDLLNVFIDAIHNSKIVGQAYNVTHPESVSWSEYIDIVMKIVGKKVNIQKIDSKLNINSRQYFPFRDCTYLLDISKLRKDGLSNPKITLTEGLKRTYEWYCKEKPSLNDKKMIRIEEVLKM